MGLSIEYVHKIFQKANISHLLYAQVHDPDRSSSNKVILLA